MSRRRFHSTLALTLLGALCACGSNNIGRLWDPGGGRGSDDASERRVAPIGGRVVDGRPKVVDTFPSGNGFPVSTPVVVVFNESLNVDSVAPRGPGQTNLFVRVAGTDGELPAEYDFLLGDTVVVMRVPTQLPEGAEIEVVITPDVRDIDGVRFGGDGDRVLSIFTADEATTIEDGELIATLPIDHDDEVIRETPVYAIFSKPVVDSSLTTSSFIVRRADLTPVAGAISFPIGNGQETRIARFDPDIPLAGSIVHEILFEDTIVFGTAGHLVLDSNRPSAEFETVPAEQPVSVTVGNATAGFPDQINASNLETLAIDVDLPASALAGDQVLVRVYGSDASTEAPDDVNYLERSAAATADGMQTVTVDFTGALGALASPKLGEGPVTFAANVSRARRTSGFILHDQDNAPTLDVTAPTLLEVGPPAGPGPNDVVTDLEQIVFHGRASERLGAASIVVGGGMADMFASSADGFFVMRPVALGRTSVPVGYTLNLTDVAGNMAPTSVAGNVVQRGIATGALAGTLTVEAYDETTLAPLAGVTVIVDPGRPAQAIDPMRQTGVTGADGRATFTGLAAASHSITLVQPGYDLLTLLDSPTAFASLPLRPTQDDTATLAGVVQFVPTVGQTALFGCNIFDDRALEALQTDVATPTSGGSFAVRPGRLGVINAFAGTFEPLALPTFVGVGCMMCGLDGQTATPPIAPLPAGEQDNFAVVPLPAQFTTLNLLGSYTKDFAASLGLGTLAGTPHVRIVGSLQGLPGMSLFGVGFATPIAGAEYTINGSYSLATYLNLIDFAPVLWVSTEAVDQDGNLARHRRLIADPNVGLTFPTAETPGIPTITPQGAPSSGSPEVTFEDRVDASTLLAGFGFVELIAEDSAQRRWTIIEHDADGAVGAESVWFPNLTGVGVAGLATGDWSVHGESRLFVTTGYGAGEFVLEERLRQEVMFARSKPETFTIQ